MSGGLVENMNILSGYLDNVLNTLVTFENKKFEDTIARINLNIDKFERMRKQLIENNDREELRRASQGMEEKVKQIVQLYDNIIEKNKNEQKKVKEEIKQLLNKKKLNNYL